MWLLKQAALRLGSSTCLLTMAMTLRHFVKHPSLGRKILEIGRIYIANKGRGSLYALANSPIYRIDEFIGQLQ